MLTDEVKKKIRIALEHLERFAPTDEEGKLDFDVEMASVEYKLNKRFTEMVEEELDRYQKGLIIWTASNVKDLEIDDKTIDLTRVVFEVIRNYKQYLTQRKETLPVENKK